MAMMLGALYKALMEPNEENARKAAEEVAGYERALADVRSDLKVVQALVGVNVAATLGLLWLIVRLGQTVAAIAAKVGVP